MNGLGQHIDGVEDLLVGEIASHDRHNLGEPSLAFGKTVQVVYQLVALVVWNHREGQKAVDNQSHLAFGELRLAGEFPPDVLGGVFPVPPALFDAVLDGAAV